MSTKDLDYKDNLLSPFKAFMPNKQNAEKTIAPLYDTVNSIEAVKIAENNIKSFLHVTKAEIDFDKPTSYNNPKVYNKAKENLDNLINNKIFTQQDKQSYLIYKISAHNHTQTGLVALCGTDLIKNNIIKHHELTREAKETDRVKNILATNGSISPVMLTHKNNNNIYNLLNNLIKNKSADLQAHDQFKITHSVYIINNQSEIDLINQNYNNITELYIADGHHRTQAALRVSQELDNNQSAQEFLTVIFPETDLNILGYHRVIKDLNNYSIDEFLTSIFEYFDLEAKTTAVLPNQTHSFGMYLNRRWYSLTLKSEYLSQDRVNNLDCNILNNLILNPILGIADITTDSRADFIGGSRSYREIEEYINNTHDGVAFTLAPTSIDDLFYVSDNNLLMPPKSTWFYPKLCDGLFFYLFD